MSEPEKKEEQESPRDAERKETITRALSSPQSALVGVVMAFFGAGGMFSFDKLSTQIDVQTAKLSEMSTVITRMEAREQSFQESISVAKIMAERHEERIRLLENQGIQREGRLTALERTVEELRKTPR